MADKTMEQAVETKHSPTAGSSNHRRVASSSNEAPNADGSMVSSSTDMVSLEGQANRLARVPDQVILSEESQSVKDTQLDLEYSREEARTALQPTVAHEMKQERQSSQGSVGTNDDGLDEYIRSPEVQNAIVERSPGGRYVRFMEKLGSGASKDVYRAYDTEEGIEVAWNVVNLSGVPKNERNRIVNEVRLLERLHHHNIISFHGSWVNRERQEVNFVTEILSSGTLKSFINKVQVIRWKIAKRWAMQILKGLEYLHGQDPSVIHRDLKCENIFINGTSGDLRIGDLGLSTVHRNGKVLSVLGTPEFMAPDMYEEKSYDVKIDIYAFGMCLLEIFTKEIPYAECTNPAQIYKKVSNGEPPDVLSRLQSKHAREFILLCLGYRNEAGEYIRPTATELLLHPFLVKRSNDDDEVVVHPPLRERPILETVEPAVSPNGTPDKKNFPVAKDTPILSKNMDQRTRSNPGGPRKQPSTDDEDRDRFDEMPESETNMKRVKVLMGRDTELQEDANKPSAPMATTEKVEASTDTANPSYLVAAAVIQNESQDVRPYADDILKLVVTLPVDGHTTNVQFDFHLVEDDPVKVAKEMVTELSIPNDAVLEISETISGLACAARMKQDKYAVLHKSQQQSSTRIQGQQDALIIKSTSGSESNGSQAQDDERAAASTDNSEKLAGHGSHQVIVVGKRNSSETEILGNSKASHAQSALLYVNSSNEVGDDIDEDVDHELRQLDEDYQKNIQRAMKVYNSRMDNLQRSQVEREAQHLKTVEKHEKERADFEKRLAQEAEQQNKRMEHLRKEWDRRREEALAQTKRRIPVHNNGAVEGSDENETHSFAVQQAHHVRSTSNTSSTTSRSPAATSEHKIPRQD